MINEKLAEVISHPADGAVAIITQGAEGPHVVNSWNSYIQVTADDKLLIPAGFMHRTEKNIEQNNKIQLTICNREVQGKMYKGTGFLIKGTVRFLKEGEEFETVKKKYDWARAALEVTIEHAIQTL